MKCICEKDSLIRAVSIVSRLATTRATLPILQNIYLEVGENGLTLKATDLEQTLEATVMADVHEKGKVTVPARMINEYLQNNSDHNLTLFTDDLTLHVHSTNHKASFKGLAAEEYPTLPAVKGDTTLTVKSEELVAALGKTLFVTAVDDTRPILTGLLWRFSGTTLELVGTDGYRMAYGQLEVPAGLAGDYILPRRSLQELVRILEGGTVEITFVGTQAKFKTNAAELTSRILEGKFPDYAAILPKKKELEVSLVAASLLQSLKLASLFSRDSAYSTKITIEGKTLRVTATSVQLGENSNEITLEKAVEAPFAISVNAQYLIEALSHIAGEVTLEFVDAKSPIVLRPAKSDRYLYLVMPLRSE